MQFQSAANRQTDSEYLADISADTAPVSVVRDALQSAFSQANAGLTAITQNPQDPNYANLQTLLFPDAPGWPRVQRMSIINFKERSTNRTRTDSCAEVLQNVVGLNTQGTDRTSQNEIVCTL